MAGSGRRLDGVDRVGEEIDDDLLEPTRLAQGQRQPAGETAVEPDVAKALALLDQEDRVVDDGRNLDRLRFDL
jgi:hypothetical protein